MILRALLLLLLAASPAAAQLVTEAPGEARVRELAWTLRCPVCQSESILESQAGTAKEMMVLVREMVAEGRSDAEIVEFFRVRYGDFVMLAPPETGVGRIMWLLPGALLLAGGVVLVRAARRRPAPPPAEAPLDAARLRELEL